MAVFLFGRSGGDTLSPVFSENSWEQIIEACQRNKAPDTWLIGDHKDMLINGTLYQIDIIGKYHDTYADGTGKAPLTLQFRNCYATNYPMDNEEYVYAGWSNSKMRSTYLPNILSRMPAEVQLGIRSMRKLAVAEDYKTLEIVADRMFLLTSTEIFGTNGYTVSGEGVQYDYYKNGGNKVKKFDDEASEWWTRTPFGESSTAFVTVSSEGEPRLVGQYLATCTSPAFCF